MLTIDKNIPFPRANMSRKIKYPFDEMEVGDSFAVKFETIEQARRIQVNLNNGTNKCRRLLKQDKEFATHLDREKKEIRIWRIK